MEHQEFRMRAWKRVYLMCELPLQLLVPEGYSGGDAIPCDCEMRMSNDWSTELDFALHLPT
jgi:hypothetical protein